NNQVLGNYIGTDGTNMLSGTFYGVEMFAGESDNVLGGIATRTGNVPDGNVIEAGGAGVLFGYGDADENNILVEGNYIGPNAAGTAVPGLGGEGILIYAHSKNAIIADNVISGWSGQGAAGEAGVMDFGSGDRIGGPNAGNVIAFNKGPGVSVGRNAD